MAFMTGPKHVDFAPKDSRRRGVEVVAAEELTGQTVVLLITLHTAGADVGSKGTVARCLISAHRGMDSENVSMPSLPSVLCFGCMQTVGRRGRAMLLFRFGV